MSKKNKLDDLAESVLDEKVIGVLTTRLTSILTPIMEAIAKKIATDITTEVTNSLTTTFEQLCAEESAKSATKLSAMNDKLKDLDDANRTLSERLESMERHSRLTNLIFHGISPHTSSDLPYAEQSSVSTLLKQESEQNLTAAIKDLCATKLMINLCDQDISTIHRLRAFKTSSAGPVIVSFTSRRIRNKIYYAKKLLRPSAPDSQHSGPCRFTSMNT